MSKRYTGHQENVNVDMQRVACFVAPENGKPVMMASPRRPTNLPLMQRYRCVKGISVRRGLGAHGKMHARCIHGSGVLATCITTAAQIAMQKSWPCCSLEPLLTSIGAAICGETVLISGEAGGSKPLVATRGLVGLQGVRKYSLTTSNDCAQGNCCHQLLRSPCLYLGWSASPNITNASEETAVLDEGRIHDHVSGQCSLHGDQTCTTSLRRTMLSFLAFSP